MAIVIDIKAQGMTQANNGLQKFEDALIRIQKIIDSLDAKLGGIGSGLAQTASAIRSSGGSGGRRPPQVGMTPMDMYRWFDAQNKASGGMFASQRKMALHNAWAHYNNQVQAGDMSALSKVNALSGAVGQSRRGGFAQKLASAIYTSRIGFGGGGSQVMPLVGKMAAMAAPALLANPATAALVAASAAAAAAFGLIAHAGLSAASSLSKLASTAYGNGAPISQAGRAQALAMVGINSEAVYQAAMTGGPARGLMAGRVDLTGGPYGNINRLQFGMEAFRQIANAKSETEAIRLAHIFGNPEAAKSYYLRDDQKQFVLNGGLKQDKQSMVLGVQLSQDKEVLMAKVDRMWTRLQSAVMPFVNKLIDLAERLLPYIQRFLNGLASWLEWINRVFDKLGIGKKDEKTETKENTEAVNQNTRALRSMREVLGGGPRAQAAIPKGLGAVALNNDAYRAALSSGLL